MRYQLRHVRMRAFAGTRTRLLGRTKAALWPLELRRHLLKAVPPVVGLRGHESRYPVSNRAVRRTKAEPQAVRIGVAGQ